ncbi:MAG: hypothetical protein AAFQ83_17340 [Bacteroidota bacterium]
MKTIISFFLILSMGLSLMAQSFAPRMLSFSAKKISYITLNDGTEIEGYFKSPKYKKGLIKEFTMVNANTNAKTKYLAEDIASMRLVPSDYGKLLATSEATSSIQKMEDTDMNQLKRDFIYFERAQLPNKKGTFVLLQLVNPGFDSKIKVYDDPYAAETGGIAVGGIQATGGNLKSYYLVREGQAFKITKGKYKQEFDDIFGTCSYLAENFEKFKWNDFAKHVVAYTENCQ